MMRIFLMFCLVVQVAFGQENTAKEKVTKPAEIVIRAKEILQIQVTGVPKAEKMRINATYSVSEKGMVTMWKVGEMKAQGKTRSALAKEIGEAYKKAGVYDAAVFQVSAMNDHHPVRDLITIGGQVRSPGQKEWKKEMTLADALKAAGGETAYAVLWRVKLYRNGKAYTYDLTRKEHSLLKIYPRDVVEVPEYSPFEGGE